MPAQTLKEIALDKAKKRPELVDYLTEEAPILEKLKWVPASHGLWNVEESLTSIKVPSFVDLGAPLPSMEAKTGLETTYVSVLGGEIEVSKDKAAQFGGTPQYFAKREKPILTKAGSDTETSLYEKQWRAAALADSKRYTKAGGTAGSGDTTGLYSIMVVRFDEQVNTGIYDPNGFDSGKLLTISPLNGGNSYHLRTQPGVIGYGVEYRGRFGWQLLDANKTVYGIVNISATKLPTMDMIDDAVSSVRGKPTNTMIMGHPRILNKVFSSLKRANVQFVNGDNNLKMAVTHYNDIPILGSYNLNEGNEAAVA